MSQTDLMNVILKDGKTTCFHRIQELTRNEYVSVGDGGNILRWAETKGDEQKWLIVPVGDDGYCEIISVQNGENMSVGSNGNILRWTKTSGKEQQFRFVNRNSTGQYNIQERTKDEYVAVGEGGNILRWSATQGIEQRFVLDPIDVKTLEKTVPDIVSGKKPCQPNEIPAPPTITDLSQSPPAQSEEYYIGYEVLPSVFVNDTTMTYKIQQVQDHPYYYLVRTRR